MSVHSIDRRDFLKAWLAALPLISLDWASLPMGKGTGGDENVFDAVIIGAGLGGLSCAAAFARQNFRVLVLEQHSKAGGYATTFKRPGGFIFDVSLHATTVGERDGLHNLIPGFPEIKEVEFVSPPSLYRIIFPDFDLTVPARDIPGYIRLLSDKFPQEKEGIAGLFRDMTGLQSDLNRYSQAAGMVDMSKFSSEFPYLLKCFNRTCGALVDQWIKDPKLKAAVSGLWGYFGLPPSKLACIYYALPTISYLQVGGWYPRGRSQALSDALVKFIVGHGGQVLTGRKVDKILVQDHAAQGVRTSDGKEYRARVVVSNANAYDTVHAMVAGEAEYLKDYLGRMDTFTASLSSFLVFLGLKKDLVRETGLKDYEIFYETGYDPEASYQAALEGKVGQGFGLTLYDNIYPGYSPAGKNTLTLITLQGYEPWQRFENDYHQGRKEAYRAEKNRIADIMIDQAERALLPGLRRAIEVKEVGTPLTNVRYTLNHRGAVYGWDQTLDNSEPRRLPHHTPIKNLWLAGAWTRPGGGYSAVLGSGLQCFAEIMKGW
jgi:all-trans-retinol 13,14-reductase